MKKNCDADKSPFDAKERNRLTIEVGKRIRQSRIEIGMRQKQLAGAIGVDYKRLSNWECGHHLPDANNIRALCACLGISMEYLVNGPATSESPSVSMEALASELLATLKGPGPFEIGGHPAPKASREALESAIKMGMAWARERSLEEPAE